MINEPSGHDQPKGMEFNQIAMSFDLCSKARRLLKLNICTGLCLLHIIQYVYIYICVPSLFVLVLLKVPDIINVTSPTFPPDRKNPEVRGPTHCQSCQLTVDTPPKPPISSSPVCLLLHFACCTSICIILIFCTRQGFCRKEKAMYIEIRETEKARKRKTET